MSEKRGDGTEIVLWTDVCVNSVFDINFVFLIECISSSNCDRDE